MKVLVAVDSFKGSLSSLEAGEAISEGIHKVYKDADVIVRPIADGGEGTVRALTAGMNGRPMRIRVTGPLGDMVEAEYGIIDKSRTAVIEMAQAAGITLVNKEDRNPLNTTTYGVGEIILDAIKRGCRNFIVGIGGSATNDGGIGMLQALGYELLDEDGKKVPYGAKGLSRLAVISDEHVLPELSECTFKVACDVTNPLCGENGCSHTFGPQKGATSDMIKDMDRWLNRFGRLTMEKYPEADMERAGAGAAGGMGFAFLSYTNAVLMPGVKIVLEETGLEDYVRDADIVVTGEGRLDGQTVMGKAPVGVAEIAKKHGKKVIAFAGCVSADAGVCNDFGIDAFFPVVRKACSLDEAMETENAKGNLTETALQVFRLISCIDKTL